MHQAINSETTFDVHHVKTSWLKNMHFESSVNGHSIHMDKLHAHGGEDIGPRPKPLFLSAIGGCAGMEVISILNKMRLIPEALEIDVSGHLKNELPKTYNKINLIFKVNCNRVDYDKVNKAILLATDKYCGVIAMARSFAVVETEIRFLSDINGESLNS